MNRKNHIILLFIFIITGATQLGSAMRASAAGVEDILPKATSGYAGYYDEWKGVGRREAIAWTYDTATKTLTFSGSGGMADNESALNLFDDEGNENTEDFESWMLEELGTWYIWYEETEHVVIGEGITSIGNYAFYNFEKLKAISIPGSVLTIGNSAFSKAGLESITIPGSVRKIGAHAFEEACLKEITIENGVEEIDVHAFYCNWELEEIVFPDSVRFVTYDSSMFGAGEGVLYLCYNLKRVTLPSTITAIPDDFCRDCMNLEMITIPTSVKTIGWNAFEYCRSLKRITIPSSVKTIGRGAFYNCGSLKKVTLPPSLKRIEEETFMGTNLKSIKLPKSLKVIGKSAFESTPLKSIKLPKSLEKLEGSAFNGTSIKTIEIPQNVKVLGHYYGYGVFPNNKKLKSVKIKSRKLKKVYERAFEKFPTKAVITVPKGKKKSYSKMFYKAGLSKKVKIKESNKW